MNATQPRPKKTRRKFRNGGRKGGKRAQNLDVTRFDGKSRPQFMPNIKTCWMNYTSNIVGIVSSLNNYVSQTYYINSIYRPDAGGIDLSSALGYNELITIYNIFEVLEAVVELTVTNNNAFPVLVGAAPTYQPISITAASSAIQLSEMEWGRGSSIPEAGGNNRATYRFQIPMSKLMGDKRYYTGDLQWHAQGVSTRPLTLMYFIFSAGALPTLTFASGLSFLFKVSYKVRWSGRIATDVSGFSRVERLGKLLALELSTFDSSDLLCRDMDSSKESLVDKEKDKLAKDKLRPILSSLSKIQFS